MNKQNIWLSLENQWINEIFSQNKFREIYEKNSKIKNENYNKYSIAFDIIEKILKVNFLKACIFKAK